MEALKIRKKIKSATLVLRNLERFKGHDVEILIISDSQEKDKASSNKGKKAGGSLNQFSNPKLKNKEKSAWELAVREKHGDS